MILKNQNSYTNEVALYLTGHFVLIWVDKRIVLHITSTASFTGINNLLL